MMHIIEPPKRVVKNNNKNYSIFLAGSIEMGAAEDWQQKIIKDIKKLFKDGTLNDNNLYIFNPRRKEWDNSWETTLNSQQFFEQVTWELDHIEKSDLVVLYLDPETKSPISLMELGIMAEMGKTCIICCPNEFWKKGNVDIVCERYNIPIVTNLNNLTKLIKNILSETCS